jgi:hypothetical protein
VPFGAFLLNAIILEQGFTTNPAIYWWLLASLPVLVATLLIEKKRTRTQKENMETNDIPLTQSKSYA